MKYRAAVATLAAVPLALGLTACGGQPEATGYRPSVPAETPTAVVSKTAVPLEKVARLNRVTFVPAMNAALTKQKSWHIVGKVTANGSTLMTMDGFQTAKPNAMSMVMAGAAFGGKTAKMIQIKNVAYVSIPGTTPGGKFVRIKASDGDLGQLIDSSDPTTIFKSFGSNLGTVKFVGAETVGGQALDRYDVTVDTAKALALQHKKLPAGAPKTLTYSLWMDKSHLVRRMSFDLVGVSMLMTMTDYNKPVHITAPPASKIVK
ncbi:hypothetical protein [Kribbella kalugense]|uniref:Lipoprotein LprG n=1 Tax=Kribbella kalugense TaxID=2512221 RepID=A0A4V3G757_9ACTN|nr:hypothetical protein [Kribbella kalugense]TDW17814.1 hypothetical protein EV650_4391 [Kribbella kalugense]